MTSSRRLLALALVLCLLAPSGASAADRCAGGGAPRPDDGGIGGTGLRPGGDGDGDGDGIGGTGLQPGGEEDDGIGGTGISRGDTGVIGTITGFASICVGGLEIHYGTDSRVLVDDRAGTTAELAVGQVVEVVATGGGDELRAAQIAVRHIVAGPVTAVDAEGNRLDVMGQAVRLSDLTRGAGDGAVAARDFAPGALVRVSGMRQEDGAIAATRVEAGVADRAWVSGPIEPSAAERVTVAGTPVQVADAAALAPGEEVRVSGRWDGSRLVAAAVERLPALPFEGRVARLEIEGFARPAGAGRLRVGSYVFDLAPGADAARPAMADERVRIEAVIDGPRAVIERVGVAPAPPPRPERPGGAAAARPDRQPPADAGRPAGAAARPDRPDRPARADRPDRPAPVSLPERPPIVDRPPIPERPPRIDRPFRPERPGG